MTKQQFLEYFRSGSYDNELTSDERLEVWLYSLAGQSDITKENLHLLCGEYGTDLATVLSEKEATND